MRDQHAPVVLEEAQAMPGQGMRSMFTMGVGFGVWLGILGTLGLAHTRVRPHVWKRHLGLSSDKEQARLRAMQLYPGADLRLKRHHGRAESLLLTYYGLYALGAGQRPMTADVDCDHVVGHDHVVHTY